MATKEFGKTKVKDAGDYTAEIYDHIGAKFPLSLTVVNEKVIGCSYETSWKEGGTTPVATGKFDERGNPVYDYQPNYTEKELTATQTKKLEAWVNAHVA